MALRNQHRISTEANEFVDGLLEMAQRQLAKEKAELAEEKEKLKQADARLQQSAARLQQSGEKLAKEQAILANINQFGELSKKEAGQCDHASKGVNQCVDRLKPRMLLAVSIKNGIKDYQGLEDWLLKKEKLAALQKTVGMIEQAIIEENALRQESLAKIAAWKDTLTQMKIWIDALPEEDRGSYTTQLDGYELSLKQIKSVEERYKKMLAARAKTDSSCEEMKKNLERVAEEFQNELPEHSIGASPSRPISFMKAASDTPPRSGSDSDQMAVASDTPSSGRSSGDVSPEKSPKKGAADDEKEMPKEMPAAKPSPVAESFASQPPAAAPPAKKGLLSKLFSSSKKPTPPALPAKPTATNGQKQEHQAPGFK